VCDFFNPFQAQFSSLQIRPNKCTYFLKLLAVSTVPDHMGKIIAKEEALEKQ
jgi:hypothetical protein